MFSYAASTIVTLLCSSGATLLAAAGEATIAAILAGVATVALGIEKSLLFREKWKLHLSIATRLEVLQLAALSGLVSESAILEERKNILGIYADQIPMAARDEH